MPRATRLKVVLCWHMHQPEYRDLISGESRLPWTYLHAIKDYSDMAAHLESVPGAVAVVNFSPVLLLQLEDYASQVAAHRTHGTPLRDALLATLAPAGIPDDLAARERLMRACLRVNRERIVERFAPFNELAKLAAGFLEPGAVRYAARDFLVDLAVWYHLGWLGESVRLGDARVAALVAKARHFDAADQRLLLEVIGELLQGIVPRYRALADLDFLAMLQAKLAARGLNYALAAQVQNITAVPFPGISLVDHDAMLVDADRVTVASAGGQNFAINVGVVAPGVELKRGWVWARTTIDGGTTSGYSEIGKPRTAIRPPRKISSESTPAKIGRSMKK